MKPQTIQIFLPDGNPRGLKIAEITSRTIQAVLIPRNQLDLACKRKELANVGIYFLFGSSDDENVEQVYIGEAEDCGERLKQHHKDKKKDFWNYAVVIISKTQFFTKSHVKYLEHHCYQEALSSARFKIEQTTPTKSYVSEPVEADLLDNFETIKVLTTTLGYNVFEKISSAPKKDLLYCSGKKAWASGDYTTDGFVVFKGSKFQKETTKGCHSWILGLRQKLIDNNQLVEQEGILVLQSDYLFKSPSAAAASVLGRAANGWDCWKYQDGKTLDEAHRKGED